MSRLHPLYSGLLRQIVRFVKAVLPLLFKIAFVNLAMVAIGYYFGTLFEYTDILSIPVKSGLFALGFESAYNLVDFGAALGFILGLCSSSLIIYAQFLPKPTEIPLMDLLMEEKQATPRQTVNIENLSGLLDNCTPEDERRLMEANPAILDLDDLALADVDVVSKALGGRRKLAEIMKEEAKKKLLEIRGA